MSLVAAEGAAAEDWDKKAETLRAAPPPREASPEAAPATEGEGGEEKEEEGVRETRSGAELAARWAEIAPQLVRIASQPLSCCLRVQMLIDVVRVQEAHLASNPEMPCGHTCAACPTKSTCHLVRSLIFAQQACTALAEHNRNRLSLRGPEQNKD